VFTNQLGRLYARTVEEYALLGILEYWIVDFRGLGGTQFIGGPKQPTVTVNQWVDGNTLGACGFML
jgi:Uma2 family endonuclease